MNMLEYQLFIKMHPKVKDLKPFYKNQFVYTKIFIKDMAIFIFLSKDLNMLSYLLKKLEPFHQL